jgi:uncharacterized protein YdhG (YjbR/CyaY superfamily)
MSSPNPVDAYLAKVRPEARATLEKLRETIRKIVPEATEVISYQIPTFKLKGRCLVGFGAFKNHCSFFPMSSTVLAEFRADVGGYETSKATIRFPDDNPLPASLVRKLVKARIAENEAKENKRL